ncbi:hypothetical protein FNV43_RR04105 [Rhamnella rubrinervis]|uniref:Uncharacterized protein n=1 Tax=Rhamnella rubrinervis TaxID=2594499 RepID=A0A8K0MPR3_9ROSA|nr:hypothetical protein FNV43_RR04105 [Rhamnella rubrinervis]
MSDVAHISPKRRKCHETTISTSAATATSTGYSNHHRKLEPPAIVSPDNSWCCPASKPIPTPPPPPPSPPAQPQRSGLSSQNQESDPLPTNPSPASSPSSSFRIRFSPSSLSPVMDFTPTTTTTMASNGYSGNHNSFPSSFSKFISVLAAGLLNPMSPPPPSKPDRARPFSR